MKELFPERDDQIDLLQCFAELGPLCPLMLVHGVSSGKTSILNHYFASRKHIRIDCTTLVSLQGFYSSILKKVASSFNQCFSLTQFGAELEKNLGDHQHVILEGFECLGEHTDVTQLILGLNKLLKSDLRRSYSFVLCLNVHNIYTRYGGIVTSCIPAIFFPPYSQSQISTILLSSITANHLKLRLFVDEDFEKEGQLKPEAAAFWSKFVQIVLETFFPYTGSDITLLCRIILKLWPVFTASLHKEAEYSDFLRLYHKHAALFRSEDLIRDPLVVEEPKHKIYALAASEKTDLPVVSRLILCAAFLASYIAPKNDYVIFSRARGLGKKKQPRRPASVKLHNPSGFEIERLIAIMLSINDASLKPVQLTLDAGFYTQFANMVSLGLLVKTLNHTSNDALDALVPKTRFRVNFGFEFVKEMAGGIGIELGDYLS